MEDRGGDGRSETPVTWRVRLARVFSTIRREWTARSLRYHEEEYPARTYTREELQQIRDEANKK